MCGIIHNILVHDKKSSDVTIGKAMSFIKANNTDLLRDHASPGHFPSTDPLLLKTVPAFYRLLCPSPHLQNTDIA